MDRIKDLRESKRMSQAELGKCVGVSQVMIAYLETGQKNPSLPLLVRLADVLTDGSLDELLGRSN